MRIEEKEFKDYCYAHLPKALMLDGINYKLDAHALLAGGYRINYAEFDGDVYHWCNNPINLFYEIVDVIPPQKSYKENEIQDATIYVTCLLELVNDCLNKCKTWHNNLYTELNQIIPKREQFYHELTSLINRYSIENGSNTPDYILASYLTSCLDNFNNIVNQREIWYDRIKTSSPVLTDICDTKISK